MEIKSWHGRLSNDGAIWKRDGGRRGTDDNPLPLADQAKELKGLIRPRARRDRITVPFVRAAVFLSEPGWSATSTISSGRTFTRRRTPATG